MGWCQLQAEQSCVRPHCNGSIVTAPFQCSDPVSKKLFLLDSQHKHTHMVPHVTIRHLLHCNRKDQQLCIIYSPVGTSFQLQSVRSLICVIQLLNILYFLSVTISVCFFLPFLLLSSNHDMTGNFTWNHSSFSLMVKITCFRSQLNQSLASTLSGSDNVAWRQTTSDHL